MCFLTNLVATRSSFVCDVLGTFLARGTRFRGWNIFLTDPGLSISPA